MVTTEMRRPPLRLTRRGRVVLLGFFILMACFASAVLLTTASRAQDRPTGPAPTTVVQPDDTLWSIAGRAAPDRDPFSTIAEIQRINDLDGFVVYSGQTLVLPR